MTFQPSLNPLPKTIDQQLKAHCTMKKTTPQTIAYYLTSHPTIANFRWTQTHSWGSTWSFLFTSISLYLTLTTTLHFLLTFLLPKRHRLKPIPLGPIPALHSLIISLTSLTIFSGILLSTLAELQETKWLFLRGLLKTTPFEWLLCFPLGTRPSGRVFFWSYLYYISRFLHMLRTLITILTKRELSRFQLLNNSFLTFMSFLWLEFSQSFQVLAILLATLVNFVVYGYRFWTGVGLPSACFPFVVNCRVVLLGCNVVCHIGVLGLHFWKAGGCNGIGAWVFNSVLNAAILFLFVDFYVKVHLVGTKSKGGNTVYQENGRGEMRKD